MDFDKRDVRFENVHNIRQEEFDLYLELAELKDSCDILDLGCGYGAVTREILKKYPAFNLSFTLIDNSLVQYNKAKEELSKFKRNDICIDYLCEDARNASFKNQFNLVFAKMFFHELKDDDQTLVLEKTLDWITPNGKMLIWDIACSKVNQEKFNEIIRYKDELATYNELKESRYFFREDEMLSKLKKYKYRSIQSYSFDLYIETQCLISDFNYDLEKLTKWNNYIAKVFLGSDIIFSNSDNNIRLKLKQTLYVATKESY
jgi:SAM-dependent methyltransferase